jgi:hypothetical protein
MSDQMSTSRATFTCLGILAALIIVGLGIFYSVKEAIDVRRQASLPTLTAAPSPTPTATPLPTPTEIIPKVIIEYEDGTKEEIQDFEFYYTYGSSTDKPKERFFVYMIEEKWSPDLHLQTVTRPGMATDEFVIKGDELKSIGYRWSEGEHDPEIVILTKSGKEFASSFFLSPSSDSYFDIPDSFLTDAQYVFAKNLYLVGDVLQDDQLKRLSLDLINYYSNQDRHVKEIVFP